MLKFHQCCETHVTVEIDIFSLSETCDEFKLSENLFTTENDLWIVMLFLTQFLHIFITSCEEKLW